MILQALTEYYNRKESLGVIAPEGWEYKSISFKALIDKNGDFIRFIDTREFIGNKAKAKSFLVPSLGEQKGSGIKANLFWENIEYFFGIPTKERTDQNYFLRVKEQHKAFINKIFSIEEQCKLSEPYRAVVNFLSNSDKTFVTKDELWNEVLEINSNLIFEVEGFGVITDLDEVKNAINNVENAKPDGFCLVSGDYSKIARLHPPIIGVKNASSTGAGIVAVNNEITQGVNKGQTPAFSSYMKQQGYNSPVSEKSAFLYTAALNYLLRNDSGNDNKIYLADSTLVFWSEKKDIIYDLENKFRWIIDNQDDPDNGVKNLKNLYESILTGKQSFEEEKNSFFVLGLSPNKSRLSVRSWRMGNIKLFANNIKQHFDDFEITLCSKQSRLFDKWDFILKKDICIERLTINQILCSTVLKYDKNNIPPNLGGKVLESVLDGTPYPETLLNLCINRVRAERHVTRARAAIIKACFNRNNRYYSKNEKEVTVSLDRSNKNIGYRLGRLFAVIEKIDEEGGSGTIRERFYSAASTSPASVFSRLLTLKNHHLAKIDNQGRKVNFEKELGEVFEGIDDFPSHLMLKEQGQFAVGYYHQRQDYFTSKKENKEKEI